MQQHGKRYRKAVEQIDPNKEYLLTEAIEAMQKLPAAKFDESVELAFKLGVDPRQSDQMVRGTVALPHGSGKTVRVAVFAKGPAAEAAQDAGAEFVGLEELIQKVQGGWTDFDVAIATPAAMQEVRKLGRQLGPKGLMPNPKTGTVTDDTAKAIGEVKAGRVEYKMDKGANLHVLLGKRSFAPADLEQNARAVISGILQARPAAAKGRYIQNCTLSSSMGPGLRIDLHEFSVS